MLQQGFIPKGHILIVSDKGDDVFTLSLLLQKNGYGIHNARTTDEYTQEIQLKIPDIILIPPIFKKTPSQQLCQSLYDNSNTRHISVLYLLTIQELKQSNFFTSDMTDYLLKPFNHQEVVKRINNYNQLSQLYKKLPDIHANETLRDYHFTHVKKMEATLTQLLVENQSLKAQISKATPTTEMNKLLFDFQGLEETIDAQQLTIKKLNAMYECFVPREFLEHLGKKNIVELRPGDQIQKKMSIIFLDIREFTSISEKMSPQENFNFLNEYLSYISPVVREHRGFIDKYIGDAIMALFPHDPEDALKAAVGIRKALSQFNIQRRIKNTAQVTAGIGQPRKKRVIKTIKIGIGIHTGSMILGVIGEKGRMQSTVISDAVNLASRLEGLTKMYGATIIVSLQSLELMDKDRYKSRYIGRIQVKGKKKPVSVYEIFDGDNPAMMRLKLKTRPIFVKAMEKYQDKKVGEAITLFRQVLNYNAEDKAAKLYLNRASTLASLSEHELAQWEPIEVLDQK